MVVLPSCRLWVVRVWEAARLLHRPSHWWEIGSHRVLAVEHSRQCHQRRREGAHSLSQNCRRLQQGTRRKAKGWRSQKSCRGLSSKEPCCKNLPVTLSVDDKGWKVCVCQQGLQITIFHPWRKHRDRLHLPFWRCSLPWPQEVLELLQEDCLWLGWVHAAAHLLDRPSPNQIQVTMSTT